MDAASLPIPESVSQLELSVAQNLASLGRDDAFSVEAKLQNLLWGVREHLNAISPVNRLPPEMLAAIFRQVASVEVPMLADDYQRPPDQDLKRIDIRRQFRLAHVCRRWRSTALGDAPLWAHVDVQGYPDAAVRFFLQRSSGYPLTLHASADKAPGLVDEILKDHGPRIRAVYLNRKQVGDTSFFHTGRAAQAAFFQQLQPGAFMPGFQVPGVANFPLAAPGFNLNANPGVAAPFFPGGPVNVNAGPLPMAAPFNLGGTAFPRLAPGPAPRNGFGDHLFGMEEAPTSILHNFCFYAPQLECFALRDVKPGPVPMSSPNLLGGGLYRLPEPSESPLKALALLLSEAYFPRNSFPNLTHLFLSFPLSPFQTQEGTKSILQMLSRTPQLQFLQLSNLRAPDLTSADFAIPLPRVSLDQLRLLAISEVQLPVVFYLLKHLVLPQPSLMFINGSEGSNVHGNVVPPSLRLPPIALLNAATFMEISVDFYTLLLTGYDAQLTSSFVFRTPPLSMSDFWTSTWLPSLHAMVSLSRITVLHINDSDNGGRVLSRLFPYFTQLEELSILLRPSPGTMRRASTTAEETARVLLGSLTPGPLTTLVCPALRSLGVEAEIDDTSFPYVELQAMAAARHQRGAPLHRFVYQWHRSAKPPSAAAADADAEERAKMALVEAALSPLLEPYVDTIEYRLSSVREKVCPFVPRECWREVLPEAERYWRDKRPSYGMPWDGEAIARAGFTDEDSDSVWRWRMGVSA